MQNLYVRLALSGSLALISWVSGPWSCLAQSKSIDQDKSLDCAITVYNQNFD